MQTTTHQYQSGELNALLDKLSGAGSSCVLNVNAKVESVANVRSRILVLQGGKLAYGGLTIPNAQDLASGLVKRFKPDWADSALGFTAKNASDRESVQSLLDLLFRLRVLNCQQVQDFLLERIIWTLEQLVDHGAQISIEPPNTNFAFRLPADRGGFFYGFSISELRQILDARRLQWRNLTPIIPGIDSVPTVATSLQNIADASTRQYIEKWMDGKHSLLDIAVWFDRDPLQLTQAYRGWVQNGWIKFIDPKVPEVKQLPVILAVDDSPIIQTMIKRILSSQYELLQAGGALESLNILSQQGDRISLLILDLTMPDIDGLQLCRTIRSIPKFKELPIIMLTARDGFFDKIKGQMAGSDRYLTKPFDAEKLLEIVQEYV
jgi:twitching motility two-component system response regulator PilG